ncbi:MULTISPECIES: hypothetical protein [Amycolatopsis]|uniref:Uncharacterized protein n=1 Tax=Amycolatopsis echigonensis TaxID=2576905 RepID=A0A2N3WLG9_9PSEU|nr:MULTISPECIES: hypothetical protein [Amycolatopsis]MBB2500807.1 hypothetical protein [Amycolatopsis echigonensis]MCG3751236.1 hypothetical protein [Amycolatopsis sp. Poz14]PKV94700.1 hypothetical protein ATK30_5581 [Amycolatopsis niigatensis]
MITVLFSVAAAVLLAVGYAIASVAGLFVTAVLITVLAIVNVRAALRPSQTAAAPAREARRPDFPGYAKLAAAVAWSGTSRHAWDCDLRPVLVRLLGPDPDGRRLLGEDLWPLVDPSRARSGDRDAPGPSHQTLAAILDRLEALR